MKYIHVYEMEKCLKQRVLMCFMSAHARKLMKSYIPFSCSEISLTLSPLNKLSSDKFLVCFNFQSPSMLLKLVKMLSECQTA